MQLERHRKEMCERVDEFTSLVLDEIYSFTRTKSEKAYVFTAYGITDLGYTVRFAEVYEHPNSRCLEQFLAKLPKAKRYFADGAPMYGELLTTSVVQAKGVMTNLVESFNAQLRQFVAALRRKTKAFAKSVNGLRRQLALLLVGQRWLRPRKPLLQRKAGSAT